MRRKNGAQADRAAGNIDPDYRDLLVLIKLVVSRFVVATIFIFLVILLVPGTWGNGILGATTSEAEEEARFYEFILAIVAVYPKASGAEEYRKSNGDMDNSF